MGPGTLSEAGQKEVRQRVETSANDIGRLREPRFACLVPAASARGHKYLMSMVFGNETDLANYMRTPAPPGALEMGDRSVVRVLVLRLRPGKGGDPASPRVVASSPGARAHLRPPETFLRLRQSARSVAWRIDNRGMS
jgi:hypothetical protein